MKTRKILAMLLTLAMLMGLLCTSAMATTQEVTLSHGSNISALTLTCLDGYCTYSRTDTNYVTMGYTNTRYTYNITVPEDTLDSTVMTIDFTPATGTVVSTIPPAGPPQPFVNMINANASNSYNVQLTNGTASLTVYVHRGLNGTPPVYGQCDTYVFNFEKGYPVSISTGDPVYIQWSSATPTLGYVLRRSSSSQLPTDFTLWVDNPGSVTQHYVPDEATGTVVIDQPPVLYHDGTNYAYTVEYKSVASTIYAVSGDTTYRIILEARTDDTSAEQGSAPSAIVSYLPIGQYASGSGWGSINKGTANNPVYKFVGSSGLESTGVSLGALGGYIEFYFDYAIQNDVSNPYGVDFVVYGNAFNGNPEPGAVQVSENGTVWYELAGSKYYSDNYVFVGNQGSSGKFVNAYSGTLRNTSVSYTKGSSIEVTLGNDGPYVLTNDTTWWPLTSEGYPMGSLAAPHTPHTNSLVTVLHNDTALSFGGVTAIQDSNTTAYYAFGYADVTPNGSPSNYGAPVNPYVPNEGGKTGGDGFDLAWAVNIETGEPVSLSGIHYVRVYSAVLDNATFNETSPEVCGIFTAYGSGSGIAVEPEITIGEVGIADLIEADVPVSVTPVSRNQQIITISNLVDALGSEFNLEISGGTYIYMNGLNTDTLSIDLSDGPVTVQIINQAGTAEPFVTLLNLYA